MITFSKLGSYGRFGNQLFQIASTIGIALRNGHYFLFPYWKYRHEFEFPLPEGGLHWADIVKERSPYYDEYALWKENNWDLEGYFQSWKYFENCKEVIHHFFSFKKPTYDGVAIHVRRGDYLNLQHIHPVLDMNYYNLAMEQFSGNKFTIFSDDMQWCKENIKGRNVSYYPVEDEIHDFKAMCGFNKFIIANSSYSWWAAYLSKSDRVIAPKIYVIGEDRDDRIPLNWVKI